MAAKKTVQQAFEEIFTRLVALEDPEPNSRDRLKFEKLINEQQVVYNLLMELPITLYEGNPISYGRTVLSSSGTLAEFFYDAAFTQRNEEEASIASPPILTADGTLLYSKIEDGWLFPAPGSVMPPLGVDIPLAGTGHGGAIMKKVGSANEYRYVDGVWSYRGQIQIDLSDSTPDVDMFTLFTAYTNAKAVATPDELAAWNAYLQAVGTQDAAAIAAAQAALASPGALAILDAATAVMAVKLGSVQMWALMSSVPVVFQGQLGTVDMLALFGATVSEPILVIGVAADGTETEITPPANTTEAEAYALEYVSVIMKFPWQDMQLTPVEDKSAELPALMAGAFTPA